MKKSHEKFVQSAPLLLNVWIALGVIFLSMFLVETADAFANDTWRIRIKEAAIVKGDQIFLGEIAVIEGSIDQLAGERLLNTPIAPAPTEYGRPMNVNKVKLQGLLRAALGENERLCLYPGSLTLQRGGAVLQEMDLQQIAVRSLTQYASQLQGEVGFTDYKLPSFVFLAHPGQYVELENTAISSGRNTLRYGVYENQNLVRRFTGSVFVDLWVDVFTASRPLPRDVSVDMDSITTIRKNLANIKGEPWDGRGGPWLTARAIVPEQVILKSDLIPQPVLRKGTMVTLLFQSSNVRLTTKAEALADGGVGQVIAVRNLQSKREIYATVIDGSTVLITPR